MPRFGLHLCYDGSDFAGWQRQKNAISVQQVIEEKLSVLLKTDVEVTGCGRTDTGVHALNFFAHVDIETEFTPDDEFCYHLNALLPGSISVYNVFEVNAEWHARFSALQRTYRYFIQTIRNPFRSDYFWYVPQSLDIKSMQEAAMHLIGEKDFTSFAKLHGGQKTGICNIHSCQIFQVDSIIIIEISADRFLRNMVRAITGTLTNIGRGKSKPESVLEIIAGKSRSLAGASVPAKGLFLWDITYDQDFSKLHPNQHQSESFLP